MNILDSSGSTTEPMAISGSCRRTDTQGLIGKTCIPAGQVPKIRELKDALPSVESMNITSDVRRVSAITVSA